MFTYDLVECLLRDANHKFYFRDLGFRLSYEGRIGTQDGPRVWKMFRLASYSDCEFDPCLFVKD